MGASLTLARRLTLPLIVPAAIAAILLTVFYALAAADPSTLVLAAVQGPFRWD